LINGLPNTITELTMDDLADIEMTTLKLIALKFENLTSLEITCNDRLDDSCCWSCFEESSSCIRHSPIPDTFPSAEDLTHAVKAALRPLKNLKNLHIGLFLSSEELLYEHFAHAQAPDNDEEGEEHPYGPELCLVCLTLYADKIRLEELNACLTLAQTFKELETVSWGSFFGRQTREVSNRMTSINIHRTDGRIRVRRKPW